MAKTTKKNLEESAQTALLDPQPPELAEEHPPEPIRDAAEPENETPPAEGEPEDWRKRPREGYRPRKDDDETIFDKLNAMDSWEGVWVYVYRIQPFSNRLMGGNRKIHVKRYDSPFDVQDLMLEAGSGVYQFQATKQDPKTGKRPMFATGEVKILNVNHPPKIPVGEWVDDPRNKEWQWAKEAIMKQAIVAAPVAPPPPDPLIGILEKTIDRQEAAMQALRAEMTANAKAAADAAAVPKPDPAAGLMAILAPFLPAIIGKLTAPPPTPPDPMASLTAAITLLKSVTPPAAAPVKEENALTALETHIELTKKLEEVSPQRESRQRSRMEGWQEFTQGLVHELAPVLQPVVQIVAMTIAQKQREAQEEAAAKKAQQPGARPAVIKSPRSARRQNQSRNRKPNSRRPARKF